MGDDTKKKETKIEKKDEFGNTVEEKKIEEEEKEEDWLTLILPSFNFLQMLDCICSTESQND